MCRHCGRESCLECFDHMKSFADLKVDPSAFQCRLLACRSTGRGTSKKRHSLKDFLPVSRFGAQELTKTIQLMEATIQSSSAPDRNVVTVAKGPDGILNLHFSNQCMQNKSQSVEYLVDSTISNSPLTFLSEVAANLAPTTHLPYHPTLPYHQPRYFRDSALTDDLFHALWSDGNPIVVTGLEAKFRLPWTPAYFRREYEETPCQIVNCQEEISMEPRTIRVGDFFDMFGRYGARDGIWKLKVGPHSNKTSH